MDSFHICKLNRQVLVQLAELVFKEPNFTLTYRDL